MQPTKHVSEIFHASCVAFGPPAVLLMGASGSGKSSLALELMSRGAILIADDRTILTSSDTELTASCPPSIRGKIEARGIGVLTAETQKSSVIRLVVDMDVPETTRLPPLRETILLGHKITLLHALNAPHFPAAILQLLKGARIA